MYKSNQVYVYYYIRLKYHLCTNIASLILLVFGSNALQQMPVHNIPIFCVLNISVSSRIMLLSRLALSASEL